jgi:hypothetical protein
MEERHCEICSKLCKGCEADTVKRLCFICPECEIDPDPDEIKIGFIEKGE